MISGVKGGWIPAARAVQTKPRLIPNWSSFR
jgi:hypothetical protein